jgi:glyoxylase-like metal-dependent hydrolase (beta-lactamase superfamily II)
MISISVLVEHPTEGLLLYETGAGKNIPEVWGPQLTDIFEPVDYTEDQELDAAIFKTGHNIKDVKGVILGHLHLDHAGGLDAFRGTDVPVYVHELELKHAFYSVATKTDLGKQHFEYCIQCFLSWKGFRCLSPHVPAV